MARTSRHPALIGVVVGVVLLALVVGFSLLPGSSDDDATAVDSTSASSGDAPRLPDTLPQGITALDTMSAGSSELAQAEQTKKTQDSIVSSLTDLYHVPAQARLYADSTLQNFTSLVEVDITPGTFLAGGLPIDPALLQLARNSTELKEVDGATCSLAYSGAIPAGQPVPDDVPAAVQCQLNDTADTWQIRTQQMTPEQAVSILRGVAG